MPTASERLAQFTQSLRYEDIPGEVVEAAKLHLLDTLGCGLAAHAVGVGTAGRSTMAEHGGEPEATVIGAQERMPAANAAFANAMLCHALDFDDTHGGSVSHVSVVVSPTALAVGEASSADGRELVAAIVGGNEVVTRVGGAASGAFHARGFHPTAIAGVFGGVTTAARLYGLPLERTVSALGIAGSMASGLFAYLEDGTDTKPIHPAWAAHGAIVATRLAHHGAEGPPHVFEGRFGLYDAFLQARETVELDFADLGSTWETPHIAYKPYPACHYIHGSLGATRSLVGQLDPADVEEVVVDVPQAGVALVLEPAPSKFAPRTPYEAKFSLQYSTACMLVHGQVGVASYTYEAIADSRVLELARKVRYEVKEYPGSEGAFPGGVHIVLKDGRTLAASLPFQLGGPENPMSGADVSEKFRLNASMALDDQDVERLEQAILGIEEGGDLRSALAPLAARKAVPA